MIPIALLEDYLIDQEDGLKKLLTWFLNLVMQLEAAQQADAEPYQRVESRKAHRNGYKERSLKTRVGELRLKKPQFREISFETKVFDRFSRVEKALVNAVLESYLQGVSTRRIQDIVSRFGIENLSASSVSRISKELDEKVEEFLKKPIERPIPYLYVDASYFKVRTESRYVTKAFMIVTGVRDDGYREILGARIADSEDELYAVRNLRVFFAGGFSGAAGEDQRPARRVCSGLPRRRGTGGDGNPDTGPPQRAQFPRGRRSGPRARNTLARRPGGAAEDMTGVQRRFQIKGEAGGMLVLDDYGHHPTEIRAVLETLANCYPERRRIIAFQPHRYSRTQASLRSSFHGASITATCCSYPRSTRRAKNPYRASTDACSSMK